MLTHTKYLIIGFLLLAKLSFAGAVVDEIIDHVNREASGSVEEYFSILEDVNFDLGIETVELDVIQSNSNNNRRGDNVNVLKNTLLVFNTSHLFYHPIKQLKAKENSFFKKVFPSSREQFFAVYRMCPF